MDATARKALLQALQVQDPALNFSPIFMGNTAYKKASELADKGGEKLATGLAQQGTDPKLAALAGTILALYPDIAMSATPMEDALLAAKNLLARTPTSIYAAPLKGYSAPFAEAKKLLTEQPYRAWAKEGEKLVGKVPSRPTTGIWEGSTEPSAIFESSSDKAEKVAAKMGSGLGKQGELYGAPQDAVITVNKMSKAPTGTVYEIKFKTPEALEKWQSKVAEYKIPGQTVEPGANSIHLIDEGNALQENVSKLLADLREAGDLKSVGTHAAEIKFIGKESYAPILTKDSHQTPAAAAIAAGLSQNKVRE